MIASWLIVIALLPAAAPAAMAAPDKLIVVTKPTVVAFFASVSEADLERDPDTNEALADFQHYASRVEPALQAMGVAFHVVYARSFQVRDGTRLKTFRPPGTGVGYYLVAPGKGPRVEERVMTDEDLVAVAREHFDLSGSDPPAHIQ